MATTEVLDNLPIDINRRTVEDYDDKLLQYLVLRFQVIARIALYKYEHDIPVRNEERFNAVTERLTGRASVAGLDPDMVREIWTIIHEYSCAKQEALIAQWESEGRPR